MASFTGVYGVSFVVAFAGASVGWAFAEPGVKKGVLHMLAAALVFACVYGYGHKVLPAKPLGEMRQPLLSLNTALIQPNIDQYKKWSPQYEAEITDTLEQLGKNLEGKNLMLAVWPESAVPGALTEEKYIRLFEGIAARSGAYQFIGSNIEHETNQYVGAYLLPPNAAAWQNYRKISRWKTLSVRLLTMWKYWGNWGRLRLARANKSRWMLPGCPWGKRFATKAFSRSCGYPKTAKGQNFL